jgi:hypothetical protein
MKLGLVKYNGGKVAPFEIEKEGQKRLWAQVPPIEGAPVQPRRWLPEKEALAYRNARGFTIVRWGEQVVPLRPQARGKPQRVARPIPKPQARAIAELMKDKPEPEPEDITPEPEPVFGMSKNGTVHRIECGQLKTIAVTFYTMEDAVTHTKYKKWCGLCMRAKA